MLTIAILKSEVLDFDPAKQARRDVIVGWKQIAEAVGFGEDALQRYCAQFKIKLPRWGILGRTTPVFIPKGKVEALRKLILARFD